MGRSVTIIAGFIVALTTLVAGVASAAAPLPALASRTDADITEALKRCLEREAPECAAPWAEELSRRYPASVTANYIRGHLDFLAGRYPEAIAKLSATTKARAGFESLVSNATHFLRLAKASRDATRGFIKRPICDGRFLVWYRRGRDEVMVQWMERVLNAAVPRLVEQLGPLPPAPVNIHLYPRASTLAAVSGLTDKQVRTSGTIALCKFNRLMITSPQDLLWGYPWADTLVHELVHLLVQRHGGAQVPVWLHEALARSLEDSWRVTDADQLDSNERALLRAAVAGRSLIGLKKMHPTMAALPSQVAAQTAFAEVHHALLWLRARRRERGQSDDLLGLITALRGRSDPLKAIDAWVPDSGFPKAWWRALRRYEDDQRAPRSDARLIRFRGQRSKRAKAGAAARHLMLANRLLAIERPKAAVIEYRRAFKAGAKGDALTWSRMARALLQINRADEAHELVSGLDDVDHAPLWVVRGRVALARKRPKEALKHAERAIWLNPVDPRVHRLRADAWRQLGRPGRADAALVDATTVEEP